MPVFTMPIGGGGRQQAAEALKYGIVAPYSTLWDSNDSDQEKTR